jgi:rSAM/selenodomain-associated transferase 2
MASNENAIQMKLCVVIPVLNERASLPATIAALRACRGVSEIIVSDGGSTDGTVAWLQSQSDIVLVRSMRGKGPQINVGAAAAFDVAAPSDISDIALLFLHADSVISQPAIDALHAALADPQLAGGAFYIRFAESRPRSLRLVAWGINVRARFRNSATGDQGIFVRKSVFDSIGGAPEWPLFEDVELVRRIKQAGKFAVLKTPMTVSGRRYIEHGVLRTALLIYSLRLAYWLGVPPHRLKNWFKDARGKQKGFS